MPINSRQKGKIGELDFARLLREVGFEARRGQQFAGGTDSPDVITSVPGVHFEVKRVERLNVNAAIEQAVADAPTSTFHCVAHRKNKKPWLATLPMRQFLAIYRRLVVLEVMASQLATNATAQHLLMTPPEGQA